jgi:type VI secretion system protein ImpF
MSTAPVRSTLQLSVFDRLLDDDPGSTAEAPLDDGQKLRIIQVAVRRDLQNLLNTRFRCIAWPPELPQLDDSLINYGLPDFTAASLNAAQDPEILVDAIKRAIRLFEPRLTDVRIEPLNDHNSIDRNYRFRIEAVLLIEDQRHRVRFDSAMESATGQFDVS